MFRHTQAPVQQQGECPCRCSPHIYCGQCSNAAAHLRHSLDNPRFSLQLSYSSSKVGLHICHHGVEQLAAGTFKPKSSCGRRGTCSPTATRAAQVQAAACTCKCGAGKGYRHVMESPIPGPQRDKVDIAIPVPEHICAMTFDPCRNKCFTEPVILNRTPTPTSQGM